MRGRKVKEFKSFYKDKNLSLKSTYNLTEEQMREGKDTLYLTVDCLKFYIQSAKKLYKQIKRNGGVI